jgi:hypothetical protein
VPDLETTWQRIASGIYSRANTANIAAPVHVVADADTVDAQVVSWLLSDQYREAIIAQYLDQQGKELGSPA